jgi:hypothetical protein
MSPHCPASVDGGVAQPFGGDQTVVVASEMDKQESTAVSGTPGLSEVPGLNNVTSKDVQHVDPNYQTR